jgi:hypothetical protein
MKKSTVAILSIATFAGLAGLANATPITEPPGLSISQTAQGGGGGSNVSSGGQNIGSSVQTNLSQASPTNLQSVPEPSALLLLGAGLLMLALWSRRVGHRLTN